MKKHCQYLFVMIMMASAVMFTACPGGGGGGEDDPTVVELQNATVSGKVLDVDGKAISGVMVTTGSLSTNTDAGGNFTFNKVGVMNGRAVLHFIKNGYFNVVRSCEKQSDEVNISVVMQKTGNTNVSTHKSFSASSAATLNVGNMEVIIPAYTLVKKDGSSFSGNVNADMFYLEPKNDNFDALMPGGDLVAVRSDNSAAQLISYGMINVSLTDNNGNELQLDKGAKSDVTFPIPAGMENNPPATMPLWSFDETKGIWVEEGTATLQGNVYVGSVSHFSWHNLDYPETRVIIRGKLLNCENKPVSYVLVTAEQTYGEYNKTSASSNSKGEYILYVPSNTPITVSVKSKNYHNYSPEESFNIPPQAGNTTVTQNFTIPCFDEPGGGGGGFENIGAVSFKSFFYNSEEEWVITFDNFGKRSRVDLVGTDLSKMIFITDSILSKEYNYNVEISDQWSEPTFGSYAVVASAYTSTFVGSTWSSYALMPGSVQSTETIAGKLCIVYSFNYGGDCVIKIAVWNNVLMLLEQCGEVLYVVTEITTNVPNVAFTKQVEVTWLP